MGTKSQLSNQYYLKQGFLIFWFFLFIKVYFRVIINNLSSNISTNDKIKALKSFANLGKIVTSIVIEIGRNDTISIDTH